MGGDKTLFYNRDQSYIIMSKALHYVLSGDVK